MFLLTMLACSGLGPAPTETPAVPEPVDARLVLHGGSVRIDRAGSALGTEDGLLLQPTDRLHTGEESFAVVLLPNRYLVRLDEDLELPVQDLALWDRPLTDRALQPQLDALLYPEEREVYADARERIAGWTLRAHNAERDGVAAPARSRGAAPAGGGGAAPAAPLRLEAPVEEQRSSGAAPSAKSEQAKGFGGGAPAAPAVVEPAPMDDGEAREVAAPPPIAHHAAKVERCVADWRALDAGLPSPLELRFSLDAQGRIDRVFTADGRPVPACMKALWIGRPPPEGGKRLILP